MPFLFNEIVGRSGTKRPDGTPWLRTDIMIHPANWASELDGCIAVGTYRPESATDFISESRKAFAALVEKLQAYGSEPVFISITGGRHYGNGAIS